MSQSPVFPFTAVVGQKQMKRALILNAVNPRIGGVLIQGEKGTAKSTAVRAFARLLPDVEIVLGCRYSCDPLGSVLCEECSQKGTSGEKLQTSKRPVRVVELPVGATEDRVIGSLDIEQAIKDGRRAFEPGLLAAANRGIIYVDEVNLLTDHLVDVLLDAAAMGQNYVEREGISISHPAEFILVGTMNPEEGELRPQLLDRFGLAVEVKGLSEQQERSEVVLRRIAYEADPTSFMSQWDGNETEERQRILEARRLLPEVTVSDAMVNAITSICAALQIDGLRGDIIMYKTCVSLAAYAGRREVTLDDVREAAALALPHRRKRQPFDHPADMEPQLNEAIQQLQERALESGPGEDNNETEPKPQDSPPPRQPNDEVFKPLLTKPLRLPESPEPHQRQMGSRDPRSVRHSLAKAESHSGRYIRAQIPRIETPSFGNLALAATLRAAAPYQPTRKVGRPNGPLLKIVPQDFREKVREQRINRVVLFVVDASGSMGTRQRMAAAKGAVVSLLTDAYQKRDKVGIIAFRGENAQLLLTPTNSVSLAEHKLRVLPTGGRTPLAHALALALQVLERAVRRGQIALSWLVILSDGRSNVPHVTNDPFADALAQAGYLKESGVRSLIIDTEAGHLRLGLCQRLAKALGGRYFRLDEISAEQIASAVAHEFER